MPTRNQDTSRGPPPSFGDEPPPKRQRVLACRRCRHRKQKCDDARPCSNCQKCGEECIPTEPAARSGIDNDYVKALEERIAELESMDPGQSLDHMRISEEASRRAIIQGDSLGMGRNHSIPNSHLQDTTAVGWRDVQKPTGNGASRSGQKLNTIRSDSQQSPHGTLSLDESSDSDMDHAIPGLITSPLTQMGENNCQSETSPGACPDVDKTLAAQSLVRGVSQELELTLLISYRDRVQSQYPFLYWFRFLEWHSEWTQCPPADIGTHLWQGFFVNLVYSIALLVLSLTTIGKSDSRAFYKSAVALLPAVLQQPDPILHAQAYLLLGMHALHQSSTQRILSLASTTMRYCVQRQFHLSEIETKPTTTALRLENQLRRRCFWSAYNFDRLVMYSFDMPPSIPDCMITLKLYANIDEDEIVSVAMRTLPDQEMPDSTTYTHVSSSLHIIQCRRIQSEIAGYTLHCDYKNQLSESLDWRVQILAEMESYKSRVKAFSDPCAKGHTSHRWLAMIYHYSLLGLYRPTKENILGPAGDWSVQASSQACLIFRKSQMDRQIAQAWPGLLVQFQSGVTLLYCFWATPPKYRTENYHSSDVSDALRACSNILAIMADRWPKADCLRDVFELLMREIPVVDVPRRPQARISERSSIAIRDKLPRVRALVIHRSILRMLDEMVFEDFPYEGYHEFSSTVQAVGDSHTQTLILDQPTDLPSGTLVFKMPFYADHMLRWDDLEGEQNLFT